MAVRMVRAKEAAVRHVSLSPTKTIDPLLPSSREQSAHVRKAQRCNAEIWSSVNLPTLARKAFDVLPATIY